MLIIYTIALLGPWRWFSNSARPAFEAFRQDGSYATWGFRRALDSAEDSCNLALCYYFMDLLYLLIRKALCIV
jgi:hypothetical protein